MASYHGEHLQKVIMAKDIKDNFRGGLVTAPILYLSNVFKEDAASFALKKRVTIDTVGKALCADFDNHSNCTLVGAYNILSHYRDAAGLSGIPAAPANLYRTVRKVAERYGYIFDKEKGIPVYNNRRFVKAMLREFHCTGAKVRAEYMVPAGRAVRLIDKGTPYMLSLAYGVYYDHTITVYGYETYLNIRTGRKYTFLVINDEWAGQERYLPWTNLARFRITCLTRIKKHSV